MTLLDRMLRSASHARSFLDAEARREVIRFVRSRWNSDGGACGRDGQSDLYYTAFGALCLRILRGRIPILRLRKYLETFGDGAELDAVHLFCLIQLRTAYPLSGARRQQFRQRLEALPVASPYDQFIQRLAMEALLKKNVAAEAIAAKSSALQTTPNLAAVAVLNQRPDPHLEALLLERACASGGFCASTALPQPDLLSTATALFALRELRADLSSIRMACLDFIESLWRESGGFSGYTQDRFEDVEYTFYALLGIGCLME